VLVSVCATVVSPVSAIALTAVFPAVGAVGALRLPHGTAHASTSTRTGLWTLAKSLHHTLLLTAVLRLLLGALTVVAPPLFAGAGAPALAGVALGAYALGTAVGGLLYGLRPIWPGTHQQQADACLLALGAVVVCGLVVQQSLLFVLLYLVAGVLEGPVVLARSLHLEAILPPERRAMGFSLQYAAIGWGFAAGGFVLAQTVTATAPQTALAAIGGFVVVAALVALLVSRPARRS
jgi:predicted MFS family arabinose efflux permease